MLNHHRFTAGQITQAPVADPDILEFHPGGFGATEFTARTLDISLVIFRRACDLEGTPGAPSIGLQQTAIFCVRFFQT